MPTQERSYGPTPNGGVYSEITYLDAEHNPVDSSVATEFILHEYDVDGRIVGSIYGRQEPPKRTIRIISNNLSFGSEPQSEDIVEQRLTINSSGRCWLSQYAYGDGDMVCVSREQFKSVDSARLFSALDEMNETYTRQPELLDGPGTWSLMVSTSTAGYQLQGALWGKYAEISDLIRETCGRSDLWGLDGGITT